MKVAIILTALSAASLATPLSDFSPRNPDALHSSANPLALKRDLTSRSPNPEPYLPAPPNHDLASLSSALEKRKGGGGGRGGGSGGGRSSGSSSGGRSSGSGSRPISSYSFSPQSNLGGRTISGSGQRPAYGNRYTGGATVPYTAGASSPSRGIRPYALPLAGFAVFPAVALGGYGYYYAYPYYGAGYPGYHYIDNDGNNKTSNVTCLCQRYQVCGCDPQDNNTQVAEILTNGTGRVGDPPVNSTQVKTVDWGNGTVASYINGSLENGTTAPGGTEPSDESQISAGVKVALGAAGYVAIGAVVWSAVLVGGLPS
jgi:hypothetical protein